MDRKKLSLRLAYLILFIFIVNTLAMKLHWYSLIWFFDMPMHFAGGFFLALLTIWILERGKVRISFLKIFFGVLIVGIGWELFELITFESTLEISLNSLDTLSDICFDLAGGLTAIIWYNSKNA